MISWVESHIGDMGGICEIKKFKQKTGVSLALPIWCRGTVWNTSYMTGDEWVTPAVVDCTTLIFFWGQKGYCG